MNREDRDFVSQVWQDLPSLEPSAELSRRVAEMPLRYPRQSGRAWPFRSLWTALGAGAFATLLGVSAGVVTFDPSELDSAASPLASAAAHDDSEWDAVLDSAWGESDLGYDTLDSSSP